MREQLDLERTLRDLLSKSEKLINKLKESEDKAKAKERIK
jgi:hypothetical protein